MLHRIGQRHEHARSDRDRYVKINWDNIHISGRYNYYRLNTYNRNPYDIGSVMHYGYSVSKNDRSKVRANIIYLFLLAIPLTNISIQVSLKLTRILLQLIIVNRRGCSGYGGLMVMRQLLYLHCVHITANFI